MPRESINSKFIYNKQSLQVRYILLERDDFLSTAFLRRTLTEMSVFASAPRGAPCREADVRRPF